MLAGEQMNSFVALHNAILQLLKVTAAPQEPRNTAAGHNDPTNHDLLYLSCPHLGLKISVPV